MTITDTTAMKLPTVVLDTTLTDLYRQSGSPYADKRIGQVLGTFSATLTLGPKIPPNRKYIYQDSLFTSSHDISPEDEAVTVIKYLSLLNQRDAFMCGTSLAIFFHMSSSPQQKRHDQKQVVKTLATLPDAQRPPLVFCDGPEYIPVKEANIEAIACKAISDYLEQYENVVPLETHCFLNSKRALAESGLPTPKSVAVTVEGFPPGAESCCALCGVEKGFVIPEGCVGVRGTWLREQSSRLYRAIESRPLPFVLKNQATFGGAGTFIVRTEEDRQTIIDDLGKGFLSRLLSAVNETNSHLEPATLLFSDLIQDPVGDFGVTFFVNEKGRRPIFLGVSEQIIEGDTAWIGSIINYQQQDELCRRFSPLVSHISEWLQSHGYIGPAGADVLEDVDGELYVVDLNVRTTGSLSLPLLRTHFTSRGLGCASSFAVDVEKRRDEFVDMFLGEFQQGRMCIISWHEDEMSGRSLGHLVVGAQDEVSLKELVDRVKETCGHVII